MHIALPCHQLLKNKFTCHAEWQKRLALNLQPVSTHAAWLTGPAQAELHPDLLEALKQRRHNPDAELNPRMFGCIATRTRPALLLSVSQDATACTQWHALGCIEKLGHKLRCYLSRSKLCSELVKGGSNSRGCLAPSTLQL